ncbi:hypothetical protein K7X08_004993 [Anisodus acutangulus]|uniref:Uncharacterized protein n=1 Tax=Anisodus acutangulus TaxID=402998 RepID=A0A9Q1MJQ6_9SOLA|nr:hypothetical protein K7X08_004993 [Anisodus acutangulus]
MRILFIPPFFTFPDRSELEGKDEVDVTSGKEFNLTTEGEANQQMEDGSNENLLKSICRLLLDFHMFEFLFLIFFGPNARPTPISSWIVLGLMADLILTTLQESEEPVEETSWKRSMSNDVDLHVLYKELDGASCPICMDHPHNAVLLLCNSHDKGCRSYICDTSYRHSNCLDRFKKLRAENLDHPPIMTQGNPDIAVETPNEHLELRNLSDPTIVDGNSNRDTLQTSGAVTLWGSGHETASADYSSDSKLKLKCPMCRGDVLGWKVVEEARKYLNLKPRSCSCESCSFIGNYRELRRHARRDHPTARPADIDPSRQRAWRRLENQREYDDIVSAVRSAMPGAVVLGDYVIENGDRLSGERVLGDYVIENGDRLSGERERGSGGNGRWLSTFFLFQMIGSMDPIPEARGGRSRALSRHRRSNGPLSRRRYPWGENLLGLHDDDDDDDDDDEDQPNLNLLSDMSDDMSTNPRRRRRLMRSRSDEDQH